MPGPKQLPVFGNLHHLIGGLPHHALTRLRKKYGPVLKLQLGQVVAVIISSPEAAKEVLKTNEISFAQRPGLYAIEIMWPDHSGIVFAPYNDYWRQVRKIAAKELLSPMNVLSFRSIREEEGWNLVEFVSSSEGHTINLSYKIFSLANDLIFRAAFGSKCKDQQNFMTVLEEAMNFTGGFSIFDLYPSLTFLRSITGAKSALLRLRKKMDRVLEDILKDHKMKRNAATNGIDEEDLVGTLLNYAANNETEFNLTINQIKSIIIEIFSAGSETSATTIEWAMSELIKNPRVMQKAQEEIRQACNGKSKIHEADIHNLEYLRAIVKETFRLHPPVPLIPRQATKKCEIGGYTVPSNTRIIINTYAMGRDPTIWTDPECFQPERFKGSSIDFKGNHFEFLPFGSGRRMCPGISFSIPSIELALAQLLYHFDWKLPNGIKLEDLDMTETFMTTARKKKNLHVMATTRITFQK